MKETMTGRQRILRTLEGKPVDRVPIDLGCHFSTGISGFAYHNLRKYLGLNTDHIEMIDMTQLLARVDADVCRRFHVDTVLLNPPWQSPQRWNPRGEYVFDIPDTIEPVLHPDGKWTIDGDGPRMTLLPGGFFFEGGWANFYGLPPEERLSLFARRARRLREETDLFTMYMGYSAFFDGLDFACDMITDPEDCMELNRRRLERQIADFDRMNRAMGRDVDCIEVNADLGSQNDLLCRPDDFLEICAPFLRDFCRHVHETSDIKIFMHSCGAISRALPMIVDCGVDIINPVQISARGMEPEKLKREFGGKITFWGGGCETQHILCRGTPDEVRRNVAELMRVFKPGGRFVFNQVHNIMGDVPPENIAAMLDAAYENAFYED